MVRLERLDLGAELPGTHREAGVDVSEGLFSVDRRLSRAQKLQIRPGKDEDLQRAPRASGRDPCAPGERRPGRRGVEPLLQSSAISFGAAVRIKYRPFPKFPSGRIARARK